MCKGGFKKSYKRHVGKMLKINYFMFRQVFISPVVLITKKLVSISDFFEKYTPLPNHNIHTYNYLRIFVLFLTIFIFPEKRNGT